MQVWDRHGFLGNAWWSWKNAWFLKQDFAQKSRLARRYPLPLGCTAPTSTPPLVHQHQNATIKRWVWPFAQIRCDGHNEDWQIGLSDMLLKDIHVDAFVHCLAASNCPLWLPRPAHFRVIKPRYPGLKLLTGDRAVARIFKVVLLGSRPPCVAFRPALGALDPASGILGDLPLDLQCGSKGNTHTDSRGQSGF